MEKNQMTMEPRTKARTGRPPFPHDPQRHPLYPLAVWSELEFERVGRVTIARVPMRALEDDLRGSRWRSRHIVGTAVGVAVKNPLDPDKPMMAHKVAVEDALERAWMLYAQKGEPKALAVAHVMMVLHGVRGVVGPFGLRVATERRQDTPTFEPRVPPAAPWNTPDGGG
jgi:hypothetical protein